MSDDTRVCALCGKSFEFDLKLMKVDRCATCDVRISSIEDPNVEEFIVMFAERLLQLEGKKAGAQIQLNEDEKVMVRNGELIRAIKALRERIPMGLVEAKGIVDEYRWRRP